MAITRSRNETQQLYPAKIDLATDGVISDETPPAGVPVQGVPLGIFTEVRRDNGTFAAAVQVLVDPPLDPGQYTQITLELNGVQIGLPQNVGNEIIAFNLFQSDLRDGITNVIQYKLKRHSGSDNESTELWALYSATLPGGNDVPGNGEHPGLGISLPTEWGDPANIDKDKIDNKVPLTLAYSHMKAHDKVTVEIGNERFDYTVKPGEVGASFVALIDREQFELVGSQDNCPFSYTVVDQLLNAAHKRRWSKIIRANVDVDGVTLGKPILREVLDDSGDVASEIDLGKLAGSDLSVVVLTSPGEFKLGDKIKAEYIATLAGHPDVVEKMEGTVEADEFGDKKRCVLKVANAKVITDSSVTVNYALFTSNNDPVGKSEVATAIVVGSRIVLEPPKIKEAPNDTSLDPLDAQNALTGVIDYDDMLVNDKISVRWTGADGTPPAGSHTTDPWPVTLVGQQEIPLDVSVIAFNLDKSITLDYSVTRGTQQPKDSQTRTLAVSPIAQSDLPKPLIVQASEQGEGPELDVSQLTTHGTLRANSYPHIALKQYVWLKAKGTLKGGGDYSKTFWQPPGSQTNATWIDQGFYDHDGFPLADLQSLEDGSDLKLEFKAGFGGTQVETEAVTFALRTYRIRAFENVVPTLGSVKGSPSGDEIPHGSTTVETAVTLSGTATPNTKIDLANNGTMMPNTEIQVNPEREWTFQLTGLVAGNTYKLSARRKDGTLSNVRDVVVAVLVKPTLTSIKGLPSGIEIPGNLRYTLERAVKLSGYATNGSKVEIFSGTSLGEVPTHATTGYWEKTVTGLTPNITQTYRVKDLHNGLTSPSVVVRPIELSLSEDFGSSNFEVSPIGRPLYDIRSGQLTWVSGSGSVRIAKYHISVGPMKDSRLIIFDNSVVDYQFRSTYSSLSFLIFGINAVDCNLTTYDKFGKALETQVFRTGPGGSRFISFSISSIFRLRIEGVLSAQMVQLDNFQFNL